ncbi:PREDICTED: noncompact myelin-associated protein [Dipodomys ordii]|uniref:Noncompact myelin-associated protein n=1 Tax=Dipodomys ordii TaxID=10020 RepID=A0A1S3GG69_DIPOR|nr:PREDICTED: noncompact myelin-associated protein [Dipodomys ordii]
MTTATTLGDAVFSLNMTTRGEDFLYKRIYTNLVTSPVATEPASHHPGGKTLSHVFLSHYRRMRTRRELEPKGPKPATPPAVDPNSQQQPATVTFSPVDLPSETR